MKNWIKVFTNEDNFSENITPLKVVTLDTDISSQKLIDFFTQKDIYKELHPILENISVSVILFDESNIHENVLINLSEKKIYIKEFFFYNLVGRIRNEFTIYTTYLILHLNNLYPDITIDIYNNIHTFLKNRKLTLKKEEYQVIFDSLDSPDEKPNIHCFALYFLSLTTYQNRKKITHLENKIIRDIIGISQAKKLLGLDENAYSYIEKGASNGYADINEKNSHINLKNEIDTNKIIFEEYAHNSLKNKRMIFWSWWTISPFVSADIAILLPMISEAKEIRLVYIDLCKESEDIFNDYIKGKDIDEEILVKEIQKIYPPVLKNYQKESLPYLVLLEKLRQFSIPVKCFGFTGIELMEKEPFLTNNNTLQYPVDKEWKKTILKEYQYISSTEKDDLTIFFHFMKPMIIFPKNLINNKIEKIIHTDKFTGFGPECPENSLSIFSKHNSSSTKSFVFPNVNQSSFYDESIVYFPYKENINAPKLDDDHFNKFKIYDTMIYSSYNGGGGNNEQDVTTPADMSHQPAY